MIAGAGRVAPLSIADGTSSMSSHGSRLSTSARGLRVVRHIPDRPGDIPAERGITRAQPPAASPDQPVARLQQTGAMAVGIEDAPLAIERDPAEVHPPDDLVGDRGAGALPLQRHISPHGRAQPRPDPAQQTVNGGVKVAPAPRQRDPCADPAAFLHAHHAQHVHAAGGEEIAKIGFVDRIAEPQQFGQRVDTPFRHVLIGHGVGGMENVMVQPRQVGRRRLAGIQMDHPVALRPGLHGTENEAGIVRPGPVAQPVDERAPGRTFDNAVDQWLEKVGQVRAVIPASAAAPAVIAAARHCHVPIWEIPIAG